MVNSNLEFSPKTYGLQHNLLYEILATTISYNSNNKEFIPNTAAMGIRYRENNLLEITPYPSTHTYTNLKEFKIVTLNFVDNVYLFALASLKKPDPLNPSLSFAIENYNFQNLSYYEYIKDIVHPNIPMNEIQIPYLKEAWAIIICKVVNEKQIIKQNQLGEIKLTQFELKVRRHKKFSNSFKTFNRAENLALEMIILATRMKIAYKNKELAQLKKIYKPIINCAYQRILYFDKSII